LRFLRREGENGRQGEGDAPSEWAANFQLKAERFSAPLGRRRASSLTLLCLLLLFHFHLVLVRRDARRLLAAPLAKFNADASRRLPRA
jgi:hypothetical protein